MARYRKLSYASENLSDWDDKNIRDKSDGMRPFECYFPESWWRELRPLLRHVTRIFSPILPGRLGRDTGILSGATGRKGSGAGAVDWQRGQRAKGLAARRVD